MKHHKIVLLFCLFALQQAIAQTDANILTAIRQESARNSQVMHTLSQLADVHGPRLMGTPNYYQAALWTQQQLKSWGIAKVDLQSFDRGHRGWAVQHFQVEMTAPQYSHIPA
jgi:hypothetical protein